MTRSTEFSHTVKHGVRVTQPDLVVHAYRDTDDDNCRSAGSPAPQVGFVVAKSVGNAVDRHRVARRLRHVAATMVDELDPADRIVVRALPGSRDALSARLHHELRAGLKRAHALMDRRR